MKGRTSTHVAHVAAHQYKSLMTKEDYWRRGWDSKTQQDSLDSVSYRF
jgi:hypothetical protein